jgi:hypothetical protein
VAEHERAAAEKERAGLPGRPQPLPGRDEDDEPDAESRSDDAADA